VIKKRICVSTDPFPYQGISLGDFKSQRLGFHFGLSIFIPFTFVDRFLGGLMKFIISILLINARVSCCFSHPTFCIICTEIKIQR